MPKQSRRSLVERIRWCALQARYNQDAADPKAADILDSIADEIAASAIEARLPEPPHDQIKGS